MLAISCGRQTHRQTDRKTGSPFKGLLKGVKQTHIYIYREREKEIEIDVGTRISVSRPLEPALGKNVHVDFEPAIKTYIYFFNQSGKRKRYEHYLNLMCFQLLSLMLKV